MNHGLAIRDSATVDFVCLNALVHRLDPGIVPFRQAHECQIHVSGGEFNVAVKLCDCFGLRTGIVTALVKYPISDLVAERVRAMGGTPFYKMFQHNGATGPNIASVYRHRAYGERAPMVFYNRANEAAARLKSGDVDGNAVFASGVRWFHSGGIFAALSDTTPELIIEGMQAARNAGAVVSFDLLPGEVVESIRRAGAWAPGDWTHHRKRRRSRRQRRGSAKGAWNCRPEGSCNIKNRTRVPSWE